MSKPGFPELIFSQEFDTKFGTLRLLIEDRRPDLQAYEGRYKLQLRRKENYGNHDETHIIVHMSEAQMRCFVDGTAKLREIYEQRLNSVDLG